MTKENTNNVDQIRDLIFGSQIKEFETKFDILKTNLENMEKTLKTLVEGLNERLEKDVNRTLEVLEKKISNLDLNHQKDKSNLQEIISATDESIQNRINIQKDEFETTLKIIKEKFTDDNIKLDTKLMETKAQLEELIAKESNTLSDKKLSRDSMAQMLLELAMNIQGTNLNEALMQSEDETK